MFLLKKVFQLRDKANPDLEKPFLEHLEDLRVMVTRVVITLLVSMIACFSFQDDLMEILKKPVEQVWLTHAKGILPEEIKPEDWEQAKKIERAALGLSPESGTYLRAQFPEETQRLVQMVSMLRAMAVLPVEKRPAFLDFSKADPAVVKALELMLEKGASPDIDPRGNVQMMSTLKPTEGFMLSMKLAFFAGIIVAFPLLLMFILQFVLPGLHEHEKKVLWPALAIGFGLFLLGVGFAYFFVLPRALVFFHEWSLKLGVSNDWRIGEYITFATQFTLLFGLSFELPVVVMVLVKIGLLSYEAMSRTRSYAILAIVVIAAVITPTPDAFTLCLMAAPMIVLYEICIWLAWYDAKKQRKAEEAEEKERMERLLTDRSNHLEDTYERDGGEDEDRGDNWDPSASEEGWKAGQEAEKPAEESAPEGEKPKDGPEVPVEEEENDDPPQSIPGEEKRRMTDL
ncbi:twin-arginine translocase subunit TatC [Luteolibacter flavescens]|uniref:Sec-independent protein translocase protein TatC n=1 Tax=Luteolibacter flavescens TaxID=1859460 RepID=A0ABT3FN66_9BACT|nr:twin-arginine translocase subunit TatC [Luteolibacter flavescens]MCW1884425.1 twin-arginine translocase subunit TatC [Luteolibacter flavescens]